MRFQGKVAIVTGAGSGIGKTIALSLATEGANIVINDIDIELARSVAGEVAALGRQSLALQGDVSVEREVVAIVDTALIKFSRIDILINNAGIADKIIPTVEQDSADWQRVVDIHLRGCYLFSKEVGKQMVKQGSGKIVNITSMAGVVGLPMRNAYSSAKAGMIMLTKVMGAEWARFNINVNAVAPGYIVTPLVEDLIRNQKFNASDIVKRTPMGRMGKPTEIAEAVMFLASDAASYITGVNLPVDGGWGSFGSYGDAYHEN